MLSKESEEKKVLFIIKQKEAEDSLQKITQSMAEAATQRKEVEHLKKQITEKEVLI